MQQLLHICNTYAAEHQLLYNGSKSFSLCFKRKELKVSSPSFFLSKSKIPMVEQCRYLGTTISIKNSDLDPKRQMRKMYANANVLLRKFSKCSINVKCYLFKTYCSNLYCAPMYCIVLYCIMRPYTDGPIGPLSYRHSSGVVRNPHSTLAE